MSASREFKKNFSKKNLEETFSKYIKSNTAIGIDKMSYEFLSVNKGEILEIINRKVLNGTYNFTRYKEKLILKNRNSLPRLISIPTVRDKVVLKALHLTLSKTFDDTKQPLPQECIREIKNSIGYFDSFIKLDISNFYGTIKHGILIDKLKKRIRNKELLALIKNAITTSTVIVGDSKTNEVVTQGVPQGLSISNVLANIYMHDLDTLFRGRGDLKYIRYVDDILILCNEKNLNIIYEEIRYLIEGIYNLSLNVDKGKKGNISNDGFDFLGYTVIFESAGVPKLSVRKTNKIRFEDSIVNIFAKYNHSDKMSPEQFLFTINNKITGSVSTQISGDKSNELKFGWLFYFSQMEDTGFLYHLDWLIEELLIKFKLYHINRKDIKSFVKAFYEIKYNINVTNYIHRPDELSLDEKIKLLEEVFKISSHQLRDKNIIEKLYWKLVYKPIQEYEKDIHSNIS